MLSTIAWPSSRVLRRLFAEERASLRAVRGEFPRSRRVLVTAPGAAFSTSAGLPLTCVSEPRLLLRPVLIARMLMEKREGITGSLDIGSSRLVIKSTESFLPAVADSAQSLWSLCCIGYEMITTSATRAE